MRILLSTILLLLLLLLYYSGYEESFSSIIYFMIASIWVDMIKMIMGDGKMLRLKERDKNQLHIGI